MIQGNNVNVKVLITCTIRLRYGYDTTTIRPRHATRLWSHVRHDYDTTATRYDCDTTTTRCGTLKHRHDTLQHRHDTLRQNGRRNVATNQKRARHRRVCRPRCHSNCTCKANFIVCLIQFCDGSESIVCCGRGNSDRVSLRIGTQEKKPKMLGEGTV